MTKIKIYPHGSSRALHLVAMIPLFDHVTQMQQSYDSANLSTVGSSAAPNNTVVNRLVCVKMLEYQDSPAHSSLKELAQVLAALPQGRRSL